MEVQPGDENPSKFSYSDKTSKLTTQRPCWITYTNDEVHDLLRTGFDKSPMFSGRIQGLGPRYCPSIEDKIDRFADKNQHQIFVEPEGWSTVEIYVNGFSTSLPEDVQNKALRKIAGFENAKMFRPGYAIEYDYFPPMQLGLTLETKLIENLYFAGQINGTTGYEEAACQGLMAGINAHNKIQGTEPFILKRSEAYIGVLIDDLITKGTEEPYRMFTSRAEYRILLRQDNADLRLTPRSYEMGLASKERYEAVQNKLAETNSIIKFLKNESVEPATVNPYLESVGSAPTSQKMKLYSILSRPQVDIVNLGKSVPAFGEYLSAKKEDSIEEAEILIKYEGYIEKEQDMAEKQMKMENLYLKPDFDYHALNSLSMEARQKLSKIRPSTIGQASRISGVSPSDISVLLVYIK
jgi:tRNA uridine 5-carboxymethylaminomethyl modification enzyme